MLDTTSSSQHRQQQTAQKQEKVETSLSSLAQDFRDLTLRLSEETHEQPPNFNDKNKRDPSLSPQNDREDEEMYHREDTHQVKPNNHQQGNHQSRDKKMGNSHNASLSDETDICLYKEVSNNTGHEVSQIPGLRHDKKLGNNNEEKVDCLEHFSNLSVGRSSPSIPSTGGTSTSDRREFEEHCNLFFGRGEDLEGEDDILLFEPKSSKPTVHPPSGVLMCQTCQQLDDTFFDLCCPSCLSLLTDPELSTVSNIFAVIRQWIPQTQTRIDFLVKEVLKRGCHVDDRDGLNDMTLLHYACKSGSPGIGDVNVSLKTVHLLAANGADLFSRCHWTDMTPLHVATYFDVAPVVDYLLTVSDRSHINDVCSGDFDGGSCLHIACSNMCLDSLKVLLSHGALIFQKNNSGRTPLECIPDPRDVSVSDPTTKVASHDVINEMRQLLVQAISGNIHGDHSSPSRIQGPVTGKVILQALGLKIGDKVYINGNKVGILRYCGGTQFSSGIWAGVELEEPEGKHNGTVEGVKYFKCPDKHGIFAPVNRVTKFGSRYRVFRGTSTAPRIVNFPKVNVSHVTPKVETGLTSLRNKLQEAVIGDRVMLVDRRKGMIRYSGETQFAPGHWFGIELEKPLGKNDGSVNGIRYFHCPPNFGLFAPPSRIMMFLKPRYRSDESDNESEYSMSMSVTSTDAYRMTPMTRRRMKALGKSPFATRFGTLSLSGSKSYLASSSPFNSPSSGNNDENWLTLGSHVLVHNEIAVIRYIGPVSFAEGTWLGLELRTPHGKNDGSVQGRRYFHCKPNHGLLVPPKNVSVHGINGAKLLKNNIPNSSPSAPPSLPGTPRRTLRRVSSRTSCI